MTHTTSKNTKYNKELVKKIIEEKRGGLLVEQLYEAIPENERPSRSYFLEFLKGIKGVYVSQYDVFKNRFFVSTLHSKEVAKRKLLVMLAAWEREHGKPAKWYVEPTKLHSVYLELLLKIPRMDKDVKWLGYTETLASFLWMSHFSGKQKMALINKNKPKPIVLEDGMVITIDEPEVEINLDDKVYVGKNSKWGNPYKVSSGGTDLECADLYAGHFWEKSLIDDIDELIGKRLYVYTGEEIYHLPFLKKMVEEKEKYKDEPDRLMPVIPPVHLYNLHRRRIFLEIICNERKKLESLEFHIFDIEDNLTYERVAEYVKCIFEFMTHHGLSIPFTITLYAWDDIKNKLNKNRYNIPIGKLLRFKYHTDKTNKDVQFRDRLNSIYENCFKGYNYKSLNIDRFLLEKGRRYWEKPHNESLMNYAGEDWRDYVKKDPNKLRLKQINDEMNMNSTKEENAEDLGEKVFDLS